MKYHERREFLREIERVAKESEATYRRRISRMMFKARAWMGGVLGGAALVVVSAIMAVRAEWIAGWVAFLLVAIGLGVCWLTAQVLFFRIAPPNGFDISRSAFPPLFKALRGLPQKPDAPAFHGVVFTMEMGAAMVEIPRWFGLLPARNYLIIGVPLLHGVTREEFLSILAHELAHLSQKHNRLTRSVYRLRVQLVRAPRELQRLVYRERRYSALGGLVEF